MRATELAGRFTTKDGGGKTVHGGPQMDDFRGGSEDGHLATRGVPCRPKKNPECSLPIVPDVVDYGYEAGTTQRV